MADGPIFKRRHFGTPQSTLLILTNFIVFAVIITLKGKSIGWFFWITIALLALYNFNNIRKDREEYNKPRIIAYVVSVLLLVVMFLFFRLKG
jgi:hypothetical protein